jgi:hypothetical protein
MKLLIAAILAFTLAACASTATPTTAAQGVYQVKSDYAAALTVAVAYKNLPTCAAGGPVLCSEPRVVAQLRQADDVAYAALQAAENTARTPGAGANAATAVIAAQQAVQALTSITATLQTRQP